MLLLFGLVVNAIASSTLDGFNIIELIGQGAAGKVFLVEDSKGDTFVLKELCKTPWNRPSLCQSQSEYDRMVSLQNERWSVKPKLFYHEQGRFAIGMELLGLDFRARRANSTFSLESILSIGIGLVEALKSLHLDHHYVHRDIWPANIATRDDSQVVLLDYGRMVRSEWEVDRRVDLIYAMLVLRFLWNGDSGAVSLFIGKYDPAKVCLGIPDELCAVMDPIGRAGVLAPIDESHYDTLIDQMRTVLNQRGIAYADAIVW